MQTKHELKLNTNANSICDMFIWYTILTCLSLWFLHADVIFRQGSRLPADPKDTHWDMIILVAGKKVLHDLLVVFVVVVLVFVVVVVDDDCRP